MSVLPRAAQTRAKGGSTAAPPRASIPPHETRPASVASGVHFGFWTGSGNFGVSQSGEEPS